MTSVVLSGRPGGTTHRAVDVLARLPVELRLIGGLAVMCRVGVPHRATVDLDAVTRGLAEQDATLSGLAVTAPGGGQYRFDNDLELDVIDVAPQDAGSLAEELALAGPLTDLELNIVAHAWAHDRATTLDLLVINEDGGAPLASALDRMVASAGGLVAMKATTVPLRASARPEKRASDLYDLGRLIVRTATLPDELSSLPPLVRGPVLDRLMQWFVDPGGRDRTYREARRFDDPPLDLDAIADAIEDLTATT